MLTLLLSLALAQSVVVENGRPPPLPVADGCERWTGTTTGGNDPSVQFDVVLCGEDTVSGEVQWSSLISGWNRRVVVGHWSSDRSALTLHDVAMAEERPNPGWRFCTITPYELTAVSPTELSGWYTAPDCNDRADIRLTSAGATGMPVAPPPPPPTTAPAFTPGGCLCAWSPSFPMGISLGLVLVSLRRRTYCSKHGSSKGLRGSSKQSSSQSGLNG